MRRGLSGSNPGLLTIELSTLPRMLHAQQLACLYQKVGKKEIDLMIAVLQSTWMVQNKLCVLEALHIHCRHQGFTACVAGWGWRWDICIMFIDKLKDPSELGAHQQRQLIGTSMLRWVKRQSESRLSLLHLLWTWTPAYLEWGGWRAVFSSVRVTDQAAMRHPAQAP
jgi:hypothetical protein